MRNKFAHAELIKNADTGKEYFKVKGENLYFDKEIYRDIRKYINKHILNNTNIEYNST